jgi:hypothetical protein
VSELSIFSIACKNPAGDAGGVVGSRTLPGELVPALKIMFRASEE